MMQVNDNWHITKHITKCQMYVSNNKHKFQRMELFLENQSRG